MHLKTQMTNCESLINKSFPLKHAESIQPFKVNNNVQNMPFHMTQTQTMDHMHKKDLNTFSNSTLNFGETMGSIGHMRAGTKHVVSP